MRGSVDAELLVTQVVECLVVDHKGTVGMLECRVCGQYGVVGLDDGRGDLRRRIDGELELGLLRVLQAQSLHEQRGEAGAGAAAERVKDEEALQARALIGQLANLVHALVDDLLADCVVAARVVVGRVLFAADELLGMKEVAVRTGAYLVDHRRLQVDEERARHVLARADLVEEGAERAVVVRLAVVGQCAVGLNAVLEAEEFPARVADLRARLANMNTNALSLFV